MKTTTSAKKILKLMNGFIEDFEKYAKIPEDATVAINDDPVTFDLLSGCIETKRNICIIHFIQGGISSVSKSLLTYKEFINSLTEYIDKVPEDVANGVYISSYESEASGLIQITVVDDINQWKYDQEQDRILIPIEIHLR